MEALFTDDENKYRSWHGSGKILIGNGVILETDIISKTELDLFNSSLNAIEAEASELMIKELKQLAPKCPEFDVNPFIKTRDNNYDIAYSLLYPNFKLFVTQKYFVKLLLQKFLSRFKSDSKFHFDLNDNNYLIQFDEKIKSIGVSFRFTEVQKSERIGFFKNLYYSLHGFIGRKRVHFIGKKGSDIKHILLVIYDTFNDVDLFKSFMKKVNSADDLHLSIVQISSGIPVSRSYDVHDLKSLNISTYKIEEFRNWVRYNNSDFYKKIAKLDSGFSIFSKFKKNDNLEIYYMYLSEIIRKLKPNVAIYDNTGEVGRVLSDVSRYYKIPSVNVEYALFSDDAIYMESNIKYTARACLGQASIDIWKKRNDPTKEHIPIGFLKLDSLEISGFDKEKFFKANDLDYNATTIFFASTWGGTNALYNKEKRTIVRNIAEFVKERKWNFIIKKHPSEVDTNLEEELTGFNYDKIKVFEHTALNLYEAICFSDIICTQFSGISVEAMYLDKSTIFYNLSGDSSFVDQIIMKDESFIYNVHTDEEFRKIADLIVSNRDKEKAGIEKSKERYLFKTDKSASERLLNLIRNINYEM